MSTPLSKANRRRLAGHLERMVATTDAAERDATSMAARRILDAHGMSWGDALNSPIPEKPLPELGVWRQTCKILLEQPKALREWERTFLADLPLFRRLSTKQRYCLKTIADRVLGPGR